MAVNNLRTLVLRGVSVSGDVVTSHTGIGSVAGMGRSPAFRSFPRHQMSSRPQAGDEPGQRQGLVDALDEDAVGRAGRPGRGAGVPRRRSPAITAGDAIRYGWRHAVGGPCPTAAGRVGPSWAEP